MDDKILFTYLQYREKQYRISCLMRDGKMMDVRCENPEQTSILGNIYIGKVQKIVKNMNAAFIDISPEVTCYYSLKDLKNPCYVRKQHEGALVQGDELIVQVSRENLKTKAPSVTTNLNLTGRYVVLTYENQRIGVSAKLDSDTRERFQNLLKENYDEKYGVIIRTNAQAASFDEVLSELNSLTEEMKAIETYGKQKACFSCLRKEERKYLKYIQNSYSTQIGEIVTDSEELYNDIKTYCAGYDTLKQIPLRLYRDKLLPLSRLYGIREQLDHALSEKVWLKSGGYLIIQPTEALTVIDVNSGKSVHGKSSEEYFLKINKEAAREIAFQMRLRNLSGIILVDFIDMAREENISELMKCLRQYVKEDPIPVQVVDMTKLQLVEMTRKKVEQSLLQQMSDE